ncbi:hypothetical protein [Roseovarius sp. D22-M7]|uniref:hypothetical protein n=1 Tax=Roseovarius sp. D22-M7 TaxID=3127116 RepID=UPI00300FAD04
MSGDGFELALQALEYRQVYRSIWPACHHFGDEFMGGGEAGEVGYRGGRGQVHVGFCLWLFEFDRPKVIVRDVLALKYLWRGCVK